jgi:hypothetical protein
MPAQAIIIGIGIMPFIMGIMPLIIGIGIMAGIAFIVFLPMWSRCLFARSVDMV